MRVSSSNNSSPNEFPPGFLFCGINQGNKVHVSKIGIPVINHKKNHSEWGNVTWKDVQSIFKKNDLTFLRNVDTRGNFFNSPLKNLPHIKHRNDDIITTINSSNINTKLGGKQQSKRKIYTGNRGGKYYMKGGKKIYVNK
tara:strand:- start:10 stop:429 length:420 start_codon:yes stop_codon:yes gene_type:complete